MIFSRVLLRALLLTVAVVSATENDTNDTEVDIFPTPAPTRDPSVEVRKQTTFPVKIGLSLESFATLNVDTFLSSMKSGMGLAEDLVEVKDPVIEVKTAFTFPSAMTVADVKPAVAKGLDVDDKDLNVTKTAARRLRDDTAVRRLGSHSGTSFDAVVSVPAENFTKALSIATALGSSGGAVAAVAAELGVNASDITADEPEVAITFTTVATTSIDTTVTPPGVNLLTTLLKTMYPAANFTVEVGPAEEKEVEVPKATPAPTPAPTKSEVLEDGAAGAAAGLPLAVASLLAAWMLQ